MSISTGLSGREEAPRDSPKKPLMNGTKPPVVSIGRPPVETEVFSKNADSNGTPLMTFWGSGQIYRNQDLYVTNPERLVLKPQNGKMPLSSIQPTCLKPSQPYPARAFFFCHDIFMTFHVMKSCQSWSIVIDNRRAPALI